MVTREHEMVLEMIRNRPALAADLLGCVRADLVPSFRRARLESSDLSEYLPAPYDADSLVSLIGGEGGDGGKLGLIVEVQRSRDKDKLNSWPVYIVNARARLDCPAILLVLCPDPGVARWARRPIDLGHPGLVLRPLVVGPEQVPVVTSADPGVVPEFAVLSAMFHGGGPDGEKVLAAMLDSVYRAGLGNAHYIDEVHAVLPEEARAILEALMQTKDHEYRTEFARHYVAEGEARGEARGEAKGRAEGEAKAVLAVLAARGVEVPEAARVRISACTDIEQLDAWVRLAATAQSVDEIFDGR